MTTDEPQRNALRRTIAPPARWSSRETGTSERTWLRGIPWGDVARVDIDALARRYDRAVIVAAHPDDETLAVGAFVATLAAAGLDLHFVLATDGEGSHSAATGLTAEVVRSVRRREFDDAVAALTDDARGGVPAGSGSTRADSTSTGSTSTDAVGRHSAGDHSIKRVEVACLALPDGGVAGAREALGDALAGLLIDMMGDGDASRMLVVAPSAFDGHIDHDTCGDIAQQVARRAGAACVTYPLWWWHWGDPAALEAAAWDECALVVPDVAALECKRAAMAAYTSQTTAFARPAAEPAMLDAGVLAHFDRLVEVLFDPDGALPRVMPGSVLSSVGRTSAASFDAMFDAGDDPWGVETRWYERRRRALIEAMLPDESLGRVLDLGCSTGALTAVLAERASAVVAVDGSARALAVARRRGLDAVSWLHRELPDVLGELSDDSTAVPSLGTPVGALFDTVVLSEIGYFLDGATLLSTLAGIDRLLAPGGIVVIANWMHPTRNIPLDGRLVDEQVSRLWPVVARYEDDDVAIVVARPDAVAAATSNPAESANDRETTGNPMNDTATTTEGRPRR